MRELRLSRSLCIRPRYFCDGNKSCHSGIDHTPGLIAQAAQEGDEIAKDIYEKAGFYLGIAAANICSAIGPRRIIIAGGVSQVGELLLEPIRRTLRERVTVMPIDQVEVVRSQLGNNAGVIGVARWAADRL